MLAQKIRSAKITIDHETCPSLILPNSCSVLLCSFDLHEPSRVSVPLIPVITLLRLYDHKHGLVSELEPIRSGTMHDTICLRRQSFALPRQFYGGQIEFHSLFLPAKNNLSKYMINGYLQSCRLRYQIQDQQGMKTEYLGAQNYQWCDRRTTIWVRKAITFQINDTAVWS